MVVFSVSLLLLLTACVRLGPSREALPDPNVRHMTQVYTYPASEFESQTTSRLIAFAHVQQALAHEVATQIASTPAGTALALSHEQLTSCVVGIIEPLIVQETWNGQIYVLRVRLTLHLSHIVPFLKQLTYDAYQFALLQDLQQRTTRVLEDIARVQEAWAATGKDVEKIGLQRDYSVKINALWALHWQQKGIAAFNRQDYITALIAQTIYSALLPQEATAYYFRALAQQALNHPHQAIEELSHAITLQPNEPTYYLKRAQFHNALQDPTQALQDASAAIHLAPHMSQAYVTRAAVYSDLGNPAQALQDYSQAIALAPHEAQYYQHRALVYLALGEVTRAVDDFTNVLTRNPQDATTYYERGKVYAALNRYQEAITDFTAALRFQPDFPEAYYHRGVAYHSLGNHTEALHDLRSAVAGKPQLADAYAYLGRVYARLGDHPRAILELSHAAQAGSGLFIRQVQERLSALGYHQGGVNGRLDTRTCDILRQYQSAQGLPVTGSLDEKTIQALFVFPSTSRSP